MGLRVEGFHLVGLRVVGLRVVGLRVVGLRVVGLRVVGLREVGLRVEGLRVVGFAVPLVHWKARPLNAAHACTAAYTLVDPDAATVEHDSMDKPEVLEQALPAKPESGTASNPKRK